MKAQGSIARRIGLGVAAACATLLTASCAAGQIAHTANEHPSIDGTNGSVGSMQLRTVAILAPKNPCYLPGADAPLSLSIVNTGSSPDSLTSVSSPRFASFTVARTADDLSPAAGSGSCSHTAAPSTSASSTTPSTAPSAAETVAPGRSVQLGLMYTGTTDPGVPTAPIVVLSGLRGGPLFPGESVPVTFTFADAGTVTLQIPVQLSAVPNNSVIPSVSNPSVTPVE